MTQTSKIEGFAYYAFVPILVCFLVYVGLGYFIMVRSQWPELPAAAVVLICLAIVAIIYAFVRHTGFALYEARGASGRRRFAWVPAFLLLFVFSGCGFLTSSMLLIEGPDIARDEIKALSGNLGSLQDDALKLTNNATYREFDGAFEPERKQLIYEIGNTMPGQCGFGSQAATILKKIEDLGDKYHVPFTPPAGSTTRIDCSKPNAAQLVDNIKKLFEERLATMDAGVRKQLGLIDKQIQGEIIDHAKKDQDDLKNIDNALVGVPYFVDSTLYHNVLTVISKSYADYSNEAGSLRAFGQDAARSNADSIDTDDLEHLGLALYLPGLIWKRFFRMPTILLCLLALGGDALAAWLVAEMVQGLRGLQDDQRLAATTGRVGGKEVTYLWRPETHPLASMEGTRR